MGLKQNIWATPAEHLRLTRPDHPVIYAAPRRIQSAARRFVDGFPGQVSYAVKANPEAVMVSNLAAAGVWAFDVASPDEMALVRAAVPQAALHYNNPVRSTEEIARAVELGVVSYAVDSFSELDKLMAALPRTAEIAVRFKLPVKGAVYDFGGKFGAPPEKAAALLRRVGAAGFRPSITFHPGTQCNDPRAWATYIAEAARISDKAGVPLARAGVKLAASAGCKFALLRAPPLTPPPTLRSWPGDAITVPLPLTSPLTTLPSRPTTEMRSEKRDKNAADMPGS